MPLTVSPLHKVFAAEIEGADLTREPTRELVDMVEDAMATYAVVVLRGQPITDDQQIRFSRAFGPLELPPSLGIRSKAARGRIRPELYDVSNLDAEGEIEPAEAPKRQFGKANEFWHTDSSFNALPTKWSLLSARELPGSGGETEFADTRTAYDALPGDLKARIDGLQAEHTIWRSREIAGFTPPTEAMRDALPPVLQPLVRTVPNGRKALVIGAHAERILGVSEEEGRTLLDELVDFATRPEFVYTHHWRTGDLTIWDNRCTLHRARPFNDRVERRDMRRTTINESGPEVSATQSA